MIADLLLKIKQEFKLTLKEFAAFVLLFGICFFTWQTYDAVNNMEARYDAEVLDSASAVLSVLQANGVYEPSEITDFLSQKPAGRSDLKKGVLNESAYMELVNVYGSLAKNAKIAFN